MRMPETRFGKRLHLALTVCVVVIFLGVHRLLNASDDWVSWSHKVTSDLAIKIAATLIAGTLLAYFFIYFFEQSASDIALEPVMPHDRKKRFKKELEHAESWLFCGNTASWNRVSTVPKLAADARQQNAEREIKLIVMDPTNTHICGQYAAYRNKVRSGLTGRKWDGNIVRQEILTTIIVCAKTKSEQPLLKVEVYLRNWFTTFRHDFSQDNLLITREDNEQPAIEINSKSVYYTVFRQEMGEIISQCKTINVDRVAAGDWRAGHIKTALLELGIPANTLDVDAPIIEEKLKNLRDPYA